MKILYVGYPLRDAAAPHQAMSALQMAKDGYSVVYVAWGNERIPDWLSEYRFLSYNSCPKKDILSSFRWLFQLIQLVRMENVDIVYVQGAQQTPFLLWLPFLKQKKLLVYHTQDYLEPGKYKFYETCERFFARRVDLVISNEPNRARFMATNYRLKQFPEIIRTALPQWWSIPERNEDDRNNFLCEFDLAHLVQPRLIVAGGCYSPDRMSSQLIEAFAKLPYNYVLIFTGMENQNSQYSSFEECLKIHSLDQKRIITLGRITYENLLKLYSIADIGILLYPNNGIGHFYQAPGRLTEYLRAGLAIITSNFPGLELLTLKYKLGKVADPYSPDSIVQAINEVGNISDSEALERRKYLRNLALTTLVYEIQAKPVFFKIFNLVSEK